MQVGGKGPKSARRKRRDDTRKACRFHGTGCRLGYCCTFMALHFSKKPDRRRDRGRGSGGEGGGRARNKWKGVLESGSQLERILRLSSVGPESIFGDGSIFDDINSELPTELLPPKLGRTKSALPSISAPFVFAPASESDEEEGGHADVSEFEPEFRLPRKRGMPMTVILERPLDEKVYSSDEYYKPKNRDPYSWQPSPYHPPPKPSNKHKPKPTRNTSLSPSRKPIRESHTHTHNSTPSSPDRKLGKAGQINLTNYSKSEDKSLSTIHQKLGKYKTNHSPRFSHPSSHLHNSLHNSLDKSILRSDMTMDTGQSGATNGSGKMDGLRVRISTTPNFHDASAAKPYSANATGSKPGSKSRESERGSKSSSSKGSKGFKGSKCSKSSKGSKGSGSRERGVGSGDEADIDTEWEGSSQPSRMDADTKSWSKWGAAGRSYRGMGQGRSRSMRAVMFGDECLSDASTNSINTIGSLGTLSSSAGESLPPPANPITALTRAKKKRRPEADPKRERAGGRAWEMGIPVPNQDPQRGHEAMHPNHHGRGQGESGHGGSEMELASMKISDTRVVGGRDKGEGNVMGLGINVVEADQQRARVKRRKLSVSELCMRLGKLEVHHSRRKDLRHASFRELVAVLPDLAQQSTSSEASRSHPNKCALLTWRPTLKGVKVDVSAPRIYGDPAILMAGHSAVPSPCGPILLSPNGQVTLLDVTRAGSHGSRWVRLPEFPMPSLHYAKACLIGSTLIVFGGASKTRKLTNHTFLFSLTHGRWVTFRTTGTPPAPRVHHAAIEVSGEYLFVHGGTAKNHILSDTYRLHVRTGRWVRCRCRGAPALAYHSADLYGRHVVVFGGTNGGELFSDLYLLNLKTLVWSTVTPKADCKRPSARMAHSSAILGDRLFIAGGHNPGFGPDHVFTDIWSFHFPTRTWDNHPTKLPNHFSGTLTFVHHSPALLPSAGFGVFTLLLVGVQNPRARTRGKGSGSGRDRERKRDGSSGNHRGRMSVEEKDASNSLFAALTIKF